MLGFGLRVLGLIRVLGVIRVLGFGCTWTLKNLSF